MNEPEVHPLDVACPACLVQAGERCTTPTHTSRRPVQWFHTSRQHLASDVSKGRVKRDLFTRPNPGTEKEF